MRQFEIVSHIRDICEARKVRLRQLEHDTGWSKSFWQRVWVGQADIGSRPLVRLAGVLETPPHVLIEYPAWPVPPPCTCPCHTQHGRDQSHI